MPRVTRTYETDLDDLAYQISRSHAFTGLRDDFVAGRVADDQAQEAISELLDGGVCRLEGDRGAEVWEWALVEADLARMIGRLYRDYLGGA